MPSFDLEHFLSQPSYAIEDRRLILGVSDFLQFSELNIEKRYQQELEDIDRTEEADDFPFEYLDHLKENARFRYEVSLPLNVRYAAVVALVTSIEWSVRPFVKRLKEQMPQKPKGRNLTVHVLSELRVRTGVGTAGLIADHAALVRVRDCIAHNAGMARGSKFENDLVEATDRLPGFSLDRRNLIGTHVCIERDALTPHITSMHDFIVASKKAAYEQRLLRD